MSPNARKLLLHRDLAELERLAVWIEGWAMWELSASLSFAVQVCLEEAVPTSLCLAPPQTIVWKLSSRSNAGTKLWSLGSRIMGAHSIRPRFCRRPFRLR